MGTSRRTLRHNVARVLALDDWDFVAEETTEVSTDTSGLLCNRLASSRRSGNRFQDKAIFRPTTSSPDDQSRRIQAFQQNDGAISVDRPFSAPCPANVPFEIFPYFDAPTIHDAINYALRRMERTVWISVTPIAGVYDYDLTDNGNPWLNELRQVGLARTVPTAASGLRYYRQRVPVRFRQDDRHIKMELLTSIYGSRAIEVQTLAPFDVLGSSDADETDADPDCVRAGAAKTLYQKLTADPSQSNRQDWVTIRSDWDAEWLKLSNERQGRLQHRIFAR